MQLFFCEINYRGLWFTCVFTKVSSNHDCLFFLVFPPIWRKFATLWKILSIWQKSAKVFIPWDVAKVFCKAFAHMICDLTEKLNLQRKFLPYSLFSKPYRNTYCNLTCFWFDKNFVKLNVKLHLHLFWRKIREIVE